MDIITLIVGVVIGYGLKSFLDKNKFSIIPKMPKKYKPVQIKEVPF